MGYLPVSFNLDGEESIWIHAVSVGETMTVRALIADLRRRYPNLRIFLSTTTMAGQQVARRNVQDVDAVFYLPLDLPFIVRRTLRLVKPRLFVMMETEIWPNLLRQCKRMGVATVMVNGRISSRSYPRYKIARPFFRTSARRRRPVLHADRGVGAARHRHRRRSGEGGRDRQPEIRFARCARRARRSTGEGRTACCDISA